MPPDSSSNATLSSGAVPLHEVIKAECSRIGLGNAEDAVGLAFSGGGVRAATFALGVLQGLAQNGDGQGGCLLDKVDYLSSVSGGGYIACWFSQQLTKRGYAATGNALRARADASVATIRNYGSYLTPQKGFFSGDTWRMVAGYLVRLVPNLLFIVFALTSGILLPYLIRDWGNWVSDHPYGYAAILCWIPPSALLLLHGFASFAPNISARMRLLGPFALIASFITGIPLAALLGDLSSGFAWPCLVIVAISQILLALFGWIRLKGGGLYRGRLVASAVAATLIGWALLGVAIFAIRWFWSHELKEVCIAVAPMVFSIVYLGICATWTYFIPFDDNDQEFINSLWGTTASISLVWALSTIVCCVAPHYLNWLKTGYDQHKKLRLSTVLASIGLISASIHSIFYDEEKPSVVPSTPVSERVRQKALAKSNRLNAFLITAAPYLVLISMLVLEAMMGGPTFRKLQSIFWYWARPNWDRPTFELATLIACALAAWLVGVFMDINRLSMKNFYRSRLTTAYLENNDTLLLSKVMDRDGGTAGERIRPYPIINCAMNVTSEKDLSVQSIRSRNFIFTPLFCGFHAHSEAEVTIPTGFEVHAYRPTEKYLSQMPQRVRLKDAKPLDPGIHLNDPMTISGAAANPAMGFHTSPGLSFLLAMFNVRLGAWVGNPRNATTYQQTASTGAPGLLVDDFLGRTGDQSNYLMLSDGGHFENTAVYELVRRRCRLIFCCDSGCDPQYMFGDLLHLVERCEIDFGVSITFPKLNQLKPFGRLGYARSNYTVGTIEYGASHTGYLVVFKPTVTYNSCETIRSFDRDNLSFPQVSTADQWFFESEFEAYRLLGIEAVETFREEMNNILRPVACDSCTADDLFKTLREAAS